MLPVAPATVSSASTSGTPALKVTASVRAKRAIAALCRILPMTGSFSIMRSRKCANASERFLSMMKATIAPTTTPQHQPPVADHEIAERR